jgi:hypothetical protein|tara:strand:+ start:1006 stop:1254 length:249 start_codon:yes stop_codon:yes gene_type:complete
LKVDGKKDIIAGVDVDPCDDVIVRTDAEGQPDVSIYGSPASRMDMVDLMEERYDRRSRGLSNNRMGYFSGIDFDENGKIKKE